MLRGLTRLTWLEIKIFVREPLGLVGTLVVPVLIFLALSRSLGPRMHAGAAEVPRFVSIDLPIFAALMIAINTVVSLVAIIAIYREGGILKRLRATPLRPHTILTAHVLVKLLLTAITLLVMILLGRRGGAVDADVPLLSFTLALLFTTASILSLGFLIASVVPTARFAQPVGSLTLYPMLAVSGLFIPGDALPPMLQAIARVMPPTYAVSLLRGIWRGDGWSAHAGDVAVLLLMAVVCTAAATRLFRWE